MKYLTLKRRNTSENISTWIWILIIVPHYAYILYFKYLVTYMFTKTMKLRKLQTHWHVLWNFCKQSFTQNFCYYVKYDVMLGNVKISFIEMQKNVPLPLKEFLQLIKNVQIPYINYFQIVANIPLRWNDIHALYAGRISFVNLYS